MNEQQAPTVPTLSELYEQDETAWLEQMSRLVGERRFDEVDYQNLSEYLSDMAKRDRREVKSRLVTLIAHLLKWDYQPDRRSNSWQATIREQRQELQFLLESGTLRGHAGEVLERAYKYAVERATDETGLAEVTFPAECPWSLQQILGEVP